MGRWAILTFDGVEEGHLPVSVPVLDELAGYLARDCDRIWTAPVFEVAMHINKASRGL